MEKILRKRVLEQDIDFILGKKNLTHLIEEFKELITKFEAQGYERISLETSYVGHDGGVEFDLIGYSLETDQEFEKRFEAEQKKRAAQEKKLQRKEQLERKKLEQLKQKYETQIN